MYSPSALVGANRCGLRTVAAPWQCSVPTPMKWDDPHLPGALVGLSKMVDLKISAFPISKPIFSSSFTARAVRGLKQKGEGGVLRVLYVPDTGLPSSSALEAHFVSSPAKTVPLASFCKWRNIILER